MDDGAQPQVAYPESVLRTFEQRLREAGLVALWDTTEDDGAVRCHADWGHNHGLKLNYGPPRGVRHGT